MTKISLSEIETVSYRSVGPMLTTDTLVVEYSNKGETYKQYLPNGGWSINTPALQFLAYIGIKPSDIEGTKKSEIEETVATVKKGEEWQMSQQVLEEGKKRLENANWFNESGDVWNSGRQTSIGGGSPDPGTGNKAGVE